ncbi:ROK family transcriptional regulator [Ponticoccus sp. SC2-23]|uniref:ROK family transcriptional regulator n=1 Tax=Alexandriicola marinus TaxID=2081710 RepID=UPI000FD8F383|nr:ROK family transcriptional regulator [Alexandriicola marinus]MBM1221372.1 ROK family transcriptional regulator [Ponticoccus sp. SC6-9]MBM1226413.1 ROK family transcriptional regulator [Ponticoccus sp. SC6-15]MBM1230364.1 ROK family transcriptional regulator [Ponticoccus sp. SC6-38]MBM1234887.1 ROK family transcriptional regulator [Ponticoccus sp. SC6-45]MBM1239385.1 ROK family transcriptional regulator [Ponticoccus sp. SC6-49]MBM1243167.1 ROK family transcriptional regulator [Ponticoccus s
MKTSIAPSFNARRILSALRGRGVASRADLARDLQLTPSTVTRLTGDLIARGLIAERDEPIRTGQKGYPARLLELAPMGLCTAGVYLDPDRILTCLADSSGGVIVSEEVRAEDRSFETLMTEAAASIDRLVAQSGLDRARLAGCGVSYPGQYSEDPGRVMRIRQFDGWPEIDVQRDLSPFFGMPVSHMNDAKAACLAELYHGRARDLGNFCHVWLSYGIGGAAVVDQKPYLGRNNQAAEWGGLFPKSRPRPSGQDLLGMLEAAGVAVTRLSDIDASHLQLPVMREWTARAIDQLRWLCLVIARTYAPEAIIFGGTLHPDLLDEIVDELSGEAPLGEDFHFAAPPILRAEQDRMPQLGAAALPVHDVMGARMRADEARRGW